MRKRSLALRARTVGRSSAIAEFIASRVRRTTRRRPGMLESLEPRWALNHEGGDEDPLQLGIYSAYIKPDDYVDAEYEAQLAAGSAAASYPLTSIPLLHSLPGATASIYLDFDGHFEAQWGSHANVTTPVFDLDGDATTFSDTELTRITNIWKRVTEDFAPFQVDVTTENPGNFSNGHGLRVSIGGDGAWLGTPAGGVAYIGNFTSSVPNTVYVFPDSLGRNEKSMAEASSHESGHAFGLQHQSTFDANGIKTAEYNPGGGGWAPIMGVSYSQALSTWYNGTSSLGSTTLQDDLSVISDEENGFGYRPDDHPDTVGSGTPLVLTGNTVAGSGIIETMTDVDAFSFSTDAGLITLNVNVAALGPNLDTVIELRNSSGTLIASAAPTDNLASVISTNVIAGDYTLLVKSTGDYGRLGQYTVSGTVNAGLFVLSHTPAEGSVVTSLPTDFQIDFSEAIDQSTLDASDLSVNGQQADSYSVVDGNTFTFHFLSSPVTTEGVQQMTMAAGAVVTIADSSPLNAFLGTFRYDAQPLAVLLAPFSNGSTVTLLSPPLISLIFTFNEAYDPSTVSASDLVLSRGQVYNVTLNDADTITFDITGISSEGPLDYSLAAGALSDLNGNPSLAYSAGVKIDFSSTAFPVPLTAVEPLGSQIFDPPVSAFIGYAGDMDDYTIELPAGARVSIVADPAATLQPQIELLGPGNAPVTSTTAAAVGQDAVLQTVAIASAGTYTIRVSGATSTLGAYSLQVVLNAAVESEEHNGGSNTSPANAQNIDASFIDLGGGVGRGAVLGITDPANGLLPAESEPNNSTPTANLANHNFDAAPANRYQLGLSGTIGSSTDVDWYRLGTMQIGDVITVTMSGTGASRGTLADATLDLYRGTGSSPTLVVTNDDSGAGLDALIYRFTVTTNDTYLLRARPHASGTTGTYQIGVFLENTSTAPGTSGSTTAETELNNTALTANNVSTSWRAVQYASSTTGSIATGDVDYFAYDFQAGDLVTLLADATSGTLDATVALLNAAGTVIASEDGTSVGPSPDSPLYSFIIPATGRYYVRTLASAGTGNYTTSVFLSSATAPTAPPDRGDYYAFTLAAGEHASVAVHSLSGGNLTLSLTDALGTVIATSVDGSTNFDKVIEDYESQLTSPYYLKVDGDNSLPYSLVVTRNTALDVETNDDPNGNLVGLDNVHGAIGHLNANKPSWYGRWNLDIDSDQTFVTMSGDLGGLPFLEQSPGSLVAHYQGTIVVDRQPSFVVFPSGSNATPIPLPGPFLPSNLPGTYAGQIDVGNGIYAYGTFEDIQLDINTILLGQLDLNGDTDGPVLGTFPANTVIFTFTGGTFDYVVPGVVTGSEGIAGLSEVNQSDELGSLEEIDGVLYMTLPVLVETTVTEPNTQLPFTIHLEGQMVASLVLPGPIDPVDWYDVHLEAGEQLVLGTDTPLDDSSLVPTNSLDPKIEIVAPGGGLVAQDDNSAPDGKNAALTFVAPAAGTYRVGVRASSGEGSYVLHSAIAPAATAPRVIDIAVRGAGGTHPWYDIPVGSGDQLKSVPVGKVDQISITFDSAVNIDDNDITLTGLGDRPPYTFSDFSYDSGSHTATWTLSSPLDTDQLLLVLNADGASPITNLSGDALDGEWNNPSSLAQLSGSVFPSGDGIPGGDFIFDWRVSPGDANGDYFVDGADYVAWADHFFQSGGLAMVGDFNTDGQVNGVDYTIWADHFSPAPPAAPPAASQTVQASPQASSTVSNDSVAPAPLARLQRASSLIVSADALPAIREAVSAVRNRVAERVVQTAVVDRWMHELSLAAATGDLGIDDLIGELARGRGRLGRGGRS